MKVLHFSYADIRGGAARAAYRIHRCLVEYGKEFDIDSNFRVVRKDSDDPSVIGGYPAQRFSALRAALRKRLQLSEQASFSTINPVLHSTASYSHGFANELKGRYLNKEFDILHLHWIGNDTLSIEEIASLRMPIAWTLHDQWPFCGAEHYISPPEIHESISKDIRFTAAYSPESRCSRDKGIDINRQTWLRKKRSWVHSMHMLPTSSWLSDCLAMSSLMADWPSTLIPYPLDTNHWFPTKKNVARESLGLNPNAHIILFGAIGGTTDSRKGADLLQEALDYYSKEFGCQDQQVEIAVFGQSEPTENRIDFPYPVRFFGSLNDNLSLRLLYSAADVMVVPSRLEAFGQTATESQACGTPVLAFRIGGLTDTVRHLETGYLADPFNPHSLSLGLHWILQDPVRLTDLSRRAIARSVKLWDPHRIASMHHVAYQEILKTRATKL